MWVDNLCGNNQQLTPFIELINHLTSKVAPNKITHFMLEIMDQANLC